MAQAQVPHRFVDGTAAIAEEVNTNFATLASFLNDALIHKDGSKAMTGHLALTSAAPSQPLHAASKGYVDLKAAEAPQWGGILGSVQVAGPIPPAAPRLRIAGGRNSTNTLDHEGCITIGFPPNCFPNGVLSLQVTPLGNIGANANSVYNARQISNTQFKVQFTQADGAGAGAPRIGMAASVAWLALGW